MLAFDSGFEHLLDSLAAKLVVGGIFAGLVVLLLREAVRIPAALRVLMLTAFVDMMGLLMVVPLMPFYVERLWQGGDRLFGLDVKVGVVQGIVVSAFTVAQLLSAPLWGRLSDRYGRRPALTVALAASGVAYLVFGFADSLWLLLLSRVVQGAGGGTVGVIQAYVADSVGPDQRARALGWLSAATNLGVAIGPVLGSKAVKWGDLDLMPGEATLHLGHAAPGVLAAIICFVNLGFALLYLGESKAKATASAPKRTSTRQAFWTVLSQFSAASSRLILIYAVAMGAFQGISAVLAFFLKERFKASEETIGYFYMYIGAISVYTRVLLLGRLVDRLGEVRLSRVGIVALAAGVCGMPLAGGIGGLAIAAALIPLGTAFTFPCVTALLSRVVPQHERGLYMGLQQTYGGIARVAAPLLYGALFDTLGVAVPFFFSAVGVLSTLLLGIGLAHRTQKASAPQ